MSALPGVGEQVLRKPEVVHVGDFCSQLLADLPNQGVAATLTELNVPGHLIAQAAAIAESTRNDVLGK